MKKCQYLRIRTKNYTKYAYCTQLKAPTSTNECSVCELYSHKQTFVKTPKKVFKTGVRKNKQKLPDSKRYSILTDDLTKCIECGMPRTDLHEIFYGVRNREKSKLYGLVIPLCTYHHNTNLKTSIHNDILLNNKWKKLAQETFMKNYNLTEKDFIKLFGRNYILEHKKKDTD